MTSQRLSKDERYKIESRVGTGAMATVYKAYDERLQRIVALKILHEHLSSNNELQLRFEQEAQLAARIVHPNIVRTYDFGLNSNQQLYIVNEFIDGRSLTLAMRQSKDEGHPFLHPILAALVALEVAKGVDAAHSNDVIHRDLKPDNVLVSHQGEIKLTDFGVARPVDSSMTQVGQFIGSLTYASPEQIKGEPLDTRSDIFSLGVMIYEILTGRLPFRSSNPTDLALKITQANVEPLAQMRSGIPDELDQMVRKCLQAIPTNRIQSASEIVNHLESYLNKKGVTSSSSIIADGFMNSELFKSTLRRGPLIEVESPQKTTQKSKEPSIEEQPPKVHERPPVVKVPHRNHKSKDPFHGKTPAQPQGKQRNHLAFVLSTLSITLLIVTLVMKERDSISAYLRGLSSTNPRDSFNQGAETQASSPDLKHLGSEVQDPGISQGGTTPAQDPTQMPQPKVQPTEGSKITENLPPKTTPKPTAAAKRRVSKKSLNTKDKKETRLPSPRVQVQPPTVSPPRNSRAATSSTGTAAAARRVVKTGQIVIKTVPGEMTVYINGVFEGFSSKQNSFRTFSIPAGNVLLKIPAQENNGKMYREYVGRFRIESGQSVVIPAIVLSPVEDSAQGDR